MIYHDHPLETDGQRLEVSPRIGARIKPMGFLMCLPLPLPTLPTILCRVC